jgi:phospholipid-binding lipoprotein MlaA
VIFASTLLGCANGAGQVREPHDPLEGFNRAMYTFNEGLDTTLLKPLAQGYHALTPDPIETGIGNFFSNLNDVLVVFNDVLQLKFHHAAADASRLVYNTTFGLLGFIDVATHMDLPKRREDFGQTLGYWGVGNGPYLVLPLFGPSTVRDGVGLVGDWYVHPIRRRVHSSTTSAVMWGLNIVDRRAQLLAAERVLDTAALDPYIFLRESYLQQRLSLVHDGNPPMPDFDAELDDILAE